MDAFLREVYAFCPDIVDQGTAYVGEAVALLKDEGKMVPPRLKRLVSGLDPQGDDFGLRVLERELRRSKKLILWWD